MNSKDDIVERETAFPNGCEAGCIVFHGGEKRHDKDCQHYPESLTKMYDDALMRIAELEDENADLRQSLEIVAADRDAKVGDVLQRNKRIAELEAEVERRDKQISYWKDSQNMQLHAGEMTSDEIRTVKAVLAAIQAGVPLVMERTNDPA